LNILQSTVGKTRSQRTIEDASKVNEIGMGATRVEERALATTGTQDYAPSYFDHNQSVLNAGVLLSIPALISQGLSKAFNVYSPLPSGFYGLQQMLLLLCFMALCRIKNPEQLKKYPPGEWGKLLGLDRIPEVGYFRKKIKQIINQARTDEFHRVLFLEWTSQLPDMFFYIDGHVRVYHGSKANLPKRYVSREKLCLNGTTEFWVNDQQGIPLLVITGELNENLKTAIMHAIHSIKKELPPTLTGNSPLFTLVFDREAYEPRWFKYLLEEHNVAVITYRKNVKDKWADELFHNVDIKIFNNDVTVQLAEMGTQLDGIWFREIRKRSDSGHQTAILTTHPILELDSVAQKMFSRWTQENFFKYMNQNFDFDKMIEYGFEQTSQQTNVPNPEYNKLNYRIKKSREKRSRLQARVFNKMENNENLTIEQALDKLSQKSDLLLKIEDYNNEIEQLIEMRKNMPSRIKVSEMPEHKRYNKLKQESKKLKNAILMLAYRAETTLYNTLYEFYPSSKKDGRMVLKEIFQSDADLIPDYVNNVLTVRLHSMSTNRFNKVAAKLCEIMNQTQTNFPGTNLLLNFESVACGLR
jgi:hypothetical protein